MDRFTRKFTRKRTTALARKFEMSWEGSPNFRWVKMHKGNRYRVTCHELGSTACTQEATYQLANEWWKKKLADLSGPTPQEIEAGAARRNWEVVHALVVNEPEGSKPYLEALLAPKPVPKDQSIETAVSEFLAVLAQTQKPKSFKEVAEFLKIVKAWWSGLSIKTIDEGTVNAAYHELAAKKLSQPAKKKRWGFFKRFVNYLAETGKIDRPRNIASKIYKFKVTATKVKTWTKDDVKGALADLPEKLRLHALLGLNCGMTNVDIGNLQKDMIENGYLTRRRVKTDKFEEVPTVSYKLWPETLALLVKFKSDHPDLWLVSTTGTKLVDNRIENGEARIKDLIGLCWRKADCPIPLFKFRSIAATVLESHRDFGRYAEHFLGHAPQSLKDKHYASPSQEIFDQAMIWLHEQIV